MTVVLSLFTENKRIGLCLVNMVGQFKKLLVDR